MKDNPLYQRAEKGAALLDKMEPGWFNKINLETLNVNFSCACVLGQLHGDYVTGLDAIKIEWADPYTAADYGFCGYTDYDDVGAAAREERALTPVWTQIIEERRNA